MLGAFMPSEISGQGSIVMQDKSISVRARGHYPSGYRWDSCCRWLGDRMGQPVALRPRDDFIVYKLDGYTPTPVSTDDVSRAIQSAVLAGGRNLIEAFVYMYGKNAFWVLSSHDNWTWEYNLVTGEWNERKSFNQSNWKGMKSLRIFDRWIVGDEVYWRSVSGSADHTSSRALIPLIWQVESGVMSGFPRGVMVPRSSFLLTTAVGTTSTVTNPRVEISWSLDGGYTYGDPVMRRLGGPGESLSHPYVLQCGLSRGSGR